ncbi:MAG: methyltransferase domain-containing protein [Candidatus Kapabacteria bacterium]|nr:methyltransferase domain-containing protein [Ignavibacteriota bacterium]MCW5886314.1 methyltransferase domain-containing protein [Candidatus Kapabacteria bacterium]
MVTNPYDSIAEIYDSMYYYPVHKLEDEYIKEMILTHSINLGKTLDLGCGTAKILEKICFDDYTGIDISENMITKSKNNSSNSKFLKQDMADLFSFEENQFDNVISLFGSFSYTNEVENTIKGIKHVLKPGGKFLIMAYGKNYPKRKTYILNKLNMNTDAHFYSSDELLRLFIPSNLVDIEVRGMTYLSEYLQNIIPNSLLKQLFNIESRILSKFLKNQLFFLIITGKKYA